MEVDDIERIIELLEGTSVSEFEFERDGAILRLSRVNRQEMLTGPVVAQVQPAIMNTGQVLSGSVSTAGGVVSEDDGLIEVTSPIVGTFYRKPAPDSDAFVEVGSRVKEGDTVCIVEAMKLMNEIPSTVSGTIERILLSDGQVAEYGEILFLVKPD